MPKVSTHSENGYNPSFGRHNKILPICDDLVGYLFVHINALKRAFVGLESSLKVQHYWKPPIILSKLLPSFSWGPRQTMHLIHQF
jgi:hypothetical protein